MLRNSICRRSGGIAADVCQDGVCGRYFRPRGESRESGDSGDRQSAVEGNSSAAGTGGALGLFRIRQFRVRGGKPESGRLLRRRLLHERPVAGPLVDPARRDETAAFPAQSRRPVTVRSGFSPRAPGSADRVSRRQKFRFLPRHPVSGGAFRTGKSPAFRSELPGLRAFGSGARSDLPGAFLPLHRPVWTVYSPGVAAEDPFR